MMNEELDFDLLASEIEAIYGALGNIEAELAEVDADFDDDWDDEWSALVPDEEDDMPSDIDEEMVDEAIKRRRVIRGGKRILKYKTSKKNYRVKYVNGRPTEVRMTPSERRKRKRAQRKAVRKRRAKRALIKRKTKLSNRKRTSSMKQQKPVVKK